MLSQKVKEYLVEDGIYDDSEDAAYRQAIIDLEIPMDSDIAEFNIYSNSVTFDGRDYELYNICWFSINSGYKEKLKMVQENLGLSEEYIPLDSFDAEHGFFYNRKDGSVIELELGENLENFLKGQIDTKWNTFNDFVEWFFELDGKEA